MANTGADQRVPIRMLPPAVNGPFQLLIKPLRWQLNGASVLSTAGLMMAYVPTNSVVVHFFLPKQQCLPLAPVLLLLLLLVVVNW